ncbi:ferrous iron transport protein A [Bacillaceae bacterium Marseille-Q3522]|nr:ferrous iron transport protein A [Bacillaceae bacterium Marseille-Q3522]
MFREAHKNEQVRIVDISQTDPTVRRRLIDFGLIKGAKVCIKYKLPFGGPYIIESGGQTIGIRRKQALTIKVEKI